MPRTASSKEIRSRVESTVAAKFVFGKSSAAGQRKMNAHVVDIYRALLVPEIDVLECHTGRGVVRREREARRCPVLGAGMERLKA